MRKRIFLLKGYSSEKHKSTFFIYLCLLLKDTSKMWQAHCNFRSKSKILQCRVDTVLEKKNIRKKSSDVPVSSGI